MPKLIKSYDKDITLVETSSYKIEFFQNYVHRGSMNAFILELAEPINGYPMNNFTGAVLVWHCPYEQISEPWLQDAIKELPRDINGEDLFYELDRLVGLDLNLKTLIGSICFKNYKHIPNKSAIQIASAWIQPNYQQFGISTGAYSFIARHKGMVVSDYAQTPLAQKLWSSKLPQVGTVSIFCEDSKEFIDSIDLEHNVKVHVWGIDSSSDDYIAINTVAIGNNMIGYKVDQDCSKILLTFTINQ